MNVNQEVDQEVATSQHQEVNVQEVTSSQNKSNIVKFVVDINKNMESLGINSLNISSNQEAILDSKEFGIFKILFNKEENTILQAANVAPGSSSVIYYSEEEEEKVTRARGETIKNQTNKKIIEYSSSSKFKTQDISIFIKTGKRIEKLISLSNREWGIIDAFPNLDINFFKSTTSNAAEYKLQRIYKSIQASDHDDTGSPRYYFNEDDDGDNDEMMID
ncbi:hypothetical protein GLOIN_2v1824718 [Rhizophagus irregularis DAOM 181602=DAOM 197198]|nr:hypothetical protein GLOIN_2v1824718 [Rhizophagus irregularis DAOM 181602=DAOM 197198]